jgi:uncharacterized protein YggU (UPF0235/DUF167 family)
LRLTVRVTPRGGREAIEGWARDEAGRPVLKLRVSAPAAEGAANAAALRLLASHLGLPRSAVRLLRGGAARVKQIEVDIDPEAFAGRLGSPPA